MTERTITELHQALIIVLGTTASTCDHEQSAIAYESLQAALAELGQLRGERRILNPYLSDGLSEEFPPPRTEPGKFIWRARHCLGVLEDSGNLQHEVGHIQTLCRGVLGEPAPWEVAHWERLFDDSGEIRCTEGEMYVFALEVNAGTPDAAREYFIDSITWDEDTSPQFECGDHGWAVEDVEWYAPLSGLPALTTTESTP